MRRIMTIALGAALFMGCGIAQDVGLTGSDKPPAEAEFRSVVKTQLLTQPGMSAFCYSIRGSSDSEVIALMGSIVGQNNLRGSQTDQLRGAAIIKQECARAFP